MKHLAVAIIVVALLAGDFFSHLLGLDADQAHGWEVYSLLGLSGAATWFAVHAVRGDS